VTREEALANAKAIADATDLPVAADLENVTATPRKAAAETIRLAGERAGPCGRVDRRRHRRTDAPIYDFQHAVER